MDYKKPQSTLVQGGVGLYPLTTADQVILADGSRLEKDGRISADSAANSEKLGGKSPEYYIQPRNLLDNSDFTRFIAQAGIMGIHGATPYAGDRWKVNGGTITGVANAEGDGYTDITLQVNSRFEQVVTGIDKYYGQPMTAALWLKNGSVIVGSAIVNAPTEDYQTPISVGNDNTHIYLQATTGDARVYIFIIATNGNSETVVAAALFPGSYTVDTLPPYVPKGYAAELAECQRYFWICANTYHAEGVGYAFNSSTCRVTIPTPQTFRITPSLTSGDGNTTNYGIKMIEYDGQSVTTTAVNRIEVNNNRIALTLGGSFTSGKMCTLRIENSFIAFSADL